MSQLGSTSKKLSQLPPKPPSTDTIATVKVSSPLNPNAGSGSGGVTPTGKPLALPTPPDAAGPFSRSAPPTPPTRPRGKSTSTVRSISPIRLGFSRSTGSDSGPETPALAFTPPEDEKGGERARDRTLSFGAGALSTRNRSRSPGPIDRVMWHDATKPVTPSNGPPQGWWGGREVEHRPWQATPKRKKTVPEEQTQAFMHTRERVAEASKAILGTALDITHEVLVLSVDLLELAPIPGLAEAARTLLTIWDTLQFVDFNRLACLRLTERCADILLSVREEIVDAGGDTGAELEMPLQKLTDSFTAVLHLLRKQASKPFLKRYLKRDEILRELAGCDSMLSDALGLFNTSIQIRTLKSIQANERRREAETSALMRTVSELAASGNALGLSTDSPPPVYAPPPGPPPLPVTSSPPLSPTSEEPDRIRAMLQQLRARQNEYDFEADTRDLRQLMRAALQTSSDAEMLEVLQVGRDEMPEAIKTLQRALEREVERESGESSPEVGPAMSASAELIAHEEQFGTVSSLASIMTVRSRSSTLGTDESVSTGASTEWSSSWGRSSLGRDTLDREFMESGIDAMRRMSRDADPLPSWTITRYEVDREERIGMGFFSDVYKGTWRNRTVAIKILAQTTPRKAFVHEISIWSTLSHPHVLRLYGASSASSDPPWFFVSPYYKNGSLVTYLKGLESLKQVDPLKLINEIAKGMAYLHHKGVLHGDLKAANVLVDDRGHCVITDFGQSEMKSEAYRISGTPPPHGTLRWQAPETLGHAIPLTQAADVYAFAITCVEILSKGGLPWPSVDDDTVRYLVLREDKRPAFPTGRTVGNELTTLIRACWDRDANARPSFKDVARDLKRIRYRAGGKDDSPRPQPVDLPSEPTHRPSPDPRPIPLPSVPDDGLRVTASPDTVVSSHKTGISVPGEWTPMTHTPAPSEHTAGESRTSLLTSTDPEAASKFDPAFPASPPPRDQHYADTRDERRYRILLQHEFHESLTLPLWSPSGTVALGDVGYLSKPEGKFVTLLNAFDPVRTSNGRTNTMASVFGYGRVGTGSMRQDKRNAAQRGIDAIQGWLNFSSKGDTSSSASSRRQYTMHLHTGHKAAWFVAESTIYRYMDSLDAPKKWFMANVDIIIQLFRPQHPMVQKEDLYFVFGCLDAPEHGQFVSHSHPDALAQFSVFAAPKVGQPWGKFTIEHPISAGPSYAEEAATNWSHKVSAVTTSTSWDTVMVARLRFKPDVAEPTSLA